MKNKFNEDQIELIQDILFNQRLIWLEDKKHYQSDLRFNDPKNVIIGLYAKGRALKDQTGFVQDV